MPMHVYVLEQLVRHRELNGQESFSRRLARLLTAFPRVRGEPTRRGLKLLASDELSLKAATDSLEDKFPGQLDIAEPKVVFQTAPFREPYMQLVIEAPCTMEHEIASWLNDRGSEIIAATRALPVTTLHALGPLRQLLGCHAELLRLSAAQAELELVFSHYQESAAPLAAGAT